MWLENARKQQLEQQQRSRSMQEDMTRPPVRVGSFEQTRATSGSNLKKGTEVQGSIYLGETFIYWRQVKAEIDRVEYEGIG